LGRRTYNDAGAYYAAKEPSYSTLRCVGRSRRDILFNEPALGEGNAERSSGNCAFSKGRRSGEKLALASPVPVRRSVLARKTYLLGAGVGAFSMSG